MLPPLEPGPFDEYVQTPDKRVDCCPTVFAEAMQLARAHFAESERVAPTRLRLITKRDRFMHNSWFHNIDTMKHGERARNHLFIHPEDAARLGLADGDVARVRSATGTVHLPVKRDPDLMPGVVAATHGWGHGEAIAMRVAHERPGVNVNRLLPSGPGSYDPLSNMAYMTGIAVEVAKVVLPGN